MVHDEAAAVEFAAKQFAVEVDISVLPRVGSDAVKVAIVVAEYDVDRPAEPTAQLVHDKGRAKIAAAEQHVGVADRGQGGSQFPDVIVDVRQDGDFHGAR